MVKNIQLTVSGKNVTSEDPLRWSSNTVDYITATFALDDEWKSCDIVRAVWVGPRAQVVTLLDGNGTCVVPHEVLSKIGKVYVNLYGIVYEEGNEFIRITTYPVNAIRIDGEAKIDGSETAPITPSQFEQFVQAVMAEVEKVTGMTATAETLPAGEDATASYSDGVLHFGIPRGNTGEKGDKGDKGEKGEKGDKGDKGDTGERGEQGIQGERGLQGIQGEQGERGEQGIQGERGETGATGAKGDTGNGIASITKTGTVGLVDTYTIAFTDGTSTTFTVTNGEDGSTNINWGDIHGSLANQTDLNDALTALNSNLNAKITNPSGGTVGQVLKKTASGEEWANESGGGGSSTWGSITGTLSNQTDLQNALDGKQDTLAAGTAIDIDENNVISVDPSELSARDIPAEGIGYKYAEGNPCVIYDGISETADDVTVTLEPIQSGSGTPSPTNIRPITGRTEVNVTRTGKNLINESNVWVKRVNGSADGIITSFNDGTWTITNTTTVDRDCILHIGKIKSGTYTLSESSDTQVQIGTMSGATFTRISYITSALKRQTFTINDDIDAWLFITANHNSTKTITNLQLELGSPATDYEPYTSQSVSVSFGQTIYGGTLDVTTGTLTVRTANIASYNGETIGEPWWSSMDEYVAGATPTIGAQIVYTLATPIELTLTPTQLSLLEGTNILTTDGDKVTLKYLGSDASNIQRVLNNTFNAFAPVEEGIATANHAVGSYISFNTQFCKVTQAISVGEIVQIGRNVQVTTVAAELLAILAQLQA